MESFPYEIYELPLFVLLGAFGGMMGALWNHINYKLSVMRKRYIQKRWMRVVEACLVAAASATVGFLMMFLINDCRPLGQDPTKYPLQVIDAKFYLGYICANFSYNFYCPAALLWRWRV